MSPAAERKLSLADVEQAPVTTPRTRIHFIIG